MAFAFPCVSAVQSVLAFASSAASSHQSAEKHAAAVTQEQSAALVPFQRHAPSLLPPQNVNSADTRELPARHFGG